MAQRAKRIGVLTFHNCINYGSYWQARCLVEALRARGHDAELLDHDCRCIRRAEVKCALQPKLPQRTPRQELRHYRLKTRKFIEAFSTLPRSQRFSLHEPEAAREYDAIVVGSDEVWNFRHPWYGSRPIFFGDGLKSDRLISYAASFGNHSAWNGIHPDWASKLGQFSAISVRDENSWHIIRNGTNREAEIVLDPCLLYPPAAETTPESTEPFALVYGHGFPAWLKIMARQWAERTSVRLVSVGYSNDFADEQRIAEGPIEFAHLMGAARAVITNFFHGCVFALLHAKPWATAPSDYRAIKIPDLAGVMDARHRLVDTETNSRTFAELLNNPERDAVATRTADLRERSQAYLDAALS